MRYSVILFLLLVFFCFSFPASSKSANKELIKAMTEKITEKIGKGRIEYFEEALKITPQLFTAGTLNVKAHLNWSYSYHRRHPEEDIIFASANLNEQFTLQTRVYRYHPSGLANRNIILAGNTANPVVLTYSGEEMRVNGAAALTNLGLKEEAHIGGVSEGEDKFTVNIDAPHWELSGKINADQTAIVPIGGGFVPLETFYFNDLSFQELLSGKVIQKSVSVQSGDYAVKGMVEISMVCHILDSLKEGKDYKIVDKLPPSNTKNPIAVTEPSGRILFKKSWWNSASHPMRSAIAAHEMAHVGQFKTNWPTDTPWDNFLWEYDAWKTEADYLSGCFDLYGADFFKFTEQEQGDVLATLDLIYKKTEGQTTLPATVMERLATEYGYDFWWRIEL